MCGKFKKLCFCVVACVFDCLIMASALCSLFTLIVAGTPIINSPSPYGTCSHCCQIQESKDIKFLLYTRENSMSPRRLYINDDIRLRNSQMAFFNRLAVYIHGFAEAAEGDGICSSQKIKSAFMQKGNYNVLIIDWSSLSAAPWYSNAVENIPITGRYVAQLLRYLVQKGLPPEQIHVIGFSLGAEIAGFVGQQMNEWGIQLPRITGLDPALPFFEGHSANRRLQQGCAKFVDVIHTDGGGFGNMAAMGHADFYPNGGKSLQPGCSIFDLTCSHARAWEYFAESILQPQTFSIKKRYSVQAFMGLAADSRLRGKFYFKAKKPKII